MMPFLIQGLQPERFANLFHMSDKDLQKIGARRVKADSKPNFPCRISLQDADIGTNMILLNYEHMDLNSPYRATHAIYVGENAEPANLAPNQVPQALLDRSLAVRAYDDEGTMLDANLIAGTELAAILGPMFKNPKISFVDVHNAARGCFAARAKRA